MSDVLDIAHLDSGLLQRRDSTLGSVTISAATAADGAILILVRDTGIRIAEHELERIFDEFAQFNVPPGTPSNGWGLGFAICRQLANVIGADISVESKLAMGTIFTVRLTSECVVDIAPAALAGACSTVASPS